MTGFGAVIVIVSADATAKLSERGTGSDGGLLERRVGKYRDGLTTDATRACLDIGREGWMLPSLFEVGNGLDGTMLCVTFTVVSILAEFSMCDGVNVTGVG